MLSQTKHCSNKFWVLIVFDPRDKPDHQTAQQYAGYKRVHISHLSVPRQGLEIDLLVGFALRLVGTLASSMPLNPSCAHRFILFPFVTRNRPRKWFKIRMSIHKIEPPKRQPSLHFYSFTNVPQSILVCNDMHVPRVFLQFPVKFSYSYIVWS